MLNKLAQFLGADVITWLLSIYKLKKIVNQIFLTDLIIRTKAFLEQSRNAFLLKGQDC